MRRTPLVLVGSLLLVVACNRREDGELPAKAPEAPQEMQNQGVQQEELPDDVVKAWKQAGADLGWIGPHRQYLHLVFGTDLGELDARRAVPAFAVRDWRVLAKLP